MQVLFVNHSKTINIFRLIYRTNTSIKEIDVLINFIVHSHLNLYISHCKYIPQIELKYFLDMGLGVSTSKIKF